MRRELLEDLVVSGFVDSAGCVHLNPLCLLTDGATERCELRAVTSKLDQWCDACSVDVRAVHAGYHTAVGDGLVVIWTPVVRDEIRGRWADVGFGAFSLDSVWRHLTAHAELRPLRRRPGSHVACTDPDLAGFVAQTVAGHPNLITVAGSWADDPAAARDAVCAHWDHPSRQPTNRTSS